MDAAHGRRLTWLSILPTHRTDKAERSLNRILNVTRDFRFQGPNRDDDPTCLALANDYSGSAAEEEEEEVARATPPHVLQPEATRKLPGSYQEAGSASRGAVVRHPRAVPLPLKQIHQQDRRLPAALGTEACDVESQGFRGILAALGYPSRAYVTGAINGGVTANDPFCPSHAGRERCANHSGSSAAAHCKRQMMRVMSVTPWGRVLSCNTRLHQSVADPVQDGTALPWLLTRIDVALAAEDQQDYPSLSLALGGANASSGAIGCGRKLLWHRRFVFPAAPSWTACVPRMWRGSPIPPGSLRPHRPYRRVNKDKTLGDGTKRGCVEKHAFTGPLPTPGGLRELLCWCGKQQPPGSTATPTKTLISAGHVALPRAEVRPPASVCNEICPPKLSASIQSDRLQNYLALNCPNGCPVPAASVVLDPCTDSAQLFEVQLMKLGPTFYRGLPFSPVAQTLEDHAVSLYSRYQLEVLPRRFPIEESRWDHASCQMTSKDTADGLYAPGARYTERLFKWLPSGEEELKQGCRVGPIYQPEEDTLRNLCNARASRVNTSMEPASPECGYLESSSHHQRSACWQWDLSDALWNNPRCRPHCDHTGVTTPVSKLGFCDAPRHQAEMATAFKRMLNGTVRKEGRSMCSGIFVDDGRSMCSGIFVDDGRSMCSGIFVENGHTVVDSELSLSETTARTRAEIARLETRRELCICPQDSVAIDRQGLHWAGDRAARDGSSQEHLTQHRGCRVILRTDSTTVMRIVNRQGTMSSELWPLAERTFKAAIEYDLDSAAEHTPGVETVVADGLSRFVRQKDGLDWQYRAGALHTLPCLMDDQSTLDGEADSAGPFVDKKEGHRRGVRDAQSYMKRFLDHGLPQSYMKRFLDHGLPQSYMKRFLDHGLPQSYMKRFLDHGLPQSYLKRFLDHGLPATGTDGLKRFLDHGLPATGTDVVCYAAYSVRLRGITLDSSTDRPLLGGRSVRHAELSALLKGRAGGLHRAAAGPGRHPQALELLPVLDKRDKKPSQAGDAWTLYTAAQHLPLWFPPRQEIAPPPAADSVALHPWGPPEGGTKSLRDFFDLVQETLSPYVLDSDKNVAARKPRSCHMSAELPALGLKPGELLED
eukprot:gene3800-biopygen3742